ncbi:MAG: ABC transporter permease [bacterium]
MSLTSLWRKITRGTHGIAHEADADRDVRDEVDHFLDEATAALVAGGMTPTAARRAASVALGTPTVIREEVRASLWESTVTSLITDVRYAARMLRRSPVFSGVVVLVISLGVGAVTTTFSAANAFLLKPLPGTLNPSRLVSIERGESKGNGRTQASYPYYRLLRDRTRTLSGLAAWSKTDLTITAGDVGHSVYGNLVSGNFFSVLGVRPALGRFFLPEEDATPLTRAVIVVSHEFWRSALAGDSSIIGRTVRVNGSAFTVIGVAPPEFRSVFTPIVTSAWVPLMMQSRIRPNRSLEADAGAWLWTFGRMNDGVSRDMVRQDLMALTRARIAEGVEPDWMKYNDDIRLISMTGLPDDARQAMFAFTGMLLAVSFLVLLIASVNVGAMLSARALARRHEMAIRVALGAARGRLVRQLLTESLVLFTLGAVGGSGVALATTRMFEMMPLPGGVPLSLELSPDIRVFAFALSVALLTGVIFGVAPALRASKPDITSRLRNDTRTGGRSGVVSNALVVGQLALSLVLLVSAGLLLRALERGNNVDPRFDVNGVATAPLKMESWGYDEAKARTFARTLRGRLEATPGVVSVSFTGTLPLQWNNSGTNIQIDDDGQSSSRDGSGVHVRTDVTDVGYFDVLRIPIVAGRAFAPSDSSAAPRVAVVNETLARKHWPDGSAVGRIFGSDGQRVTIIGVARDAKYSTLTETTPEQVYFPIGQSWPGELALLVRTMGGVDALTSTIPNVVSALDPSVPHPMVVSLAHATKFVLLPQRVAALVAGALGLVGLMLATVGLYGIISYSASRRSREIGIRMALGARAADVQRMVVLGGMRLAGLGVSIGLVLAAAASRLLVSFLYGVSPLDAPTFIATSLLFVAVASLASYLPARRAAMADPLVALRAE